MGSLPPVMENQRSFLGNSIEVQDSLRCVGTENHPRKGRPLEKQVSFQHGTEGRAMERQRSLRGFVEKQKSFRVVIERQLSFMNGERKMKKNESPGKRGDSPLHIAARTGNLGKVMESIRSCNGAEELRELLSKQNLEGETPLYTAADNGHSLVVEEMLKHMNLEIASIAARNGFDPFHVAAKQGHLETLKRLLETFPNLAMTTDLLCTTALHTAATQGHIDVVNLLLKTDSHLAKIAKNNGKTALHSAARMGHVEVVKSLIGNDASIGFRTDKKGQTALHMAVKGKHEGIVLELVRPDPKVLSVEDNKGNTPLHIATKKGRTKIVRCLVSFDGINLNALNKAGDTALDIAEKIGNAELVLVLKEAGAATAKDLGKPLNPAKHLKQTVSDIRHEVQSQLQQSRQTGARVQRIAKRLKKLHINGLNNAINSATVVAVLIATVAFAAIFTKKKRQRLHLCNKRDPKMLNKIMKLGGKKFSKSDQDNTSGVNTVVRSSRPTTAAAPPSSTGESQSAAPSPSQTPNHPMFTAPPSLEVLPLLKDVSSSDRPLLFMKKAHMCSCQCDFSDSLIMPREKEIKRQTLLELVDFLHSSSGKVNETMQSELIRMVSANMFRCLPPAHYENTGAPPEGNDPEEEEPYLEPWWPHLQLVYELLLRYVVSSEIEPKTAKKFINHTFVSRLLDLFDSEDPREREYLKTVLHRIYGKFIFHRPFIRCSIYNIFYKYLYETERCVGIGELLEILGSVINGFTVPMREEHVLYLVKAILPLHKSKGISIFHQQLSYCVVQFVEKDYKLADTVIRGLLKYWPLTNCNKEVLFLGELEEVLDVTEPSEFQHCVVPLFRQIGKCLNSANFQVAERALFLWNNEHIVGLIAENKDVIFPIIFEALERNMKGHWNQAVHGLSENVRRMFMEMDNELFEECEKRHLENEAKACELLEQREMTWKRLEEAASLAAN